MIDIIRDIINNKWFCAVFGAIVVFIMMAPDIFNGIRGKEDGDENDE